MTIPDRGGESETKRIVQLLTFATTETKHQMKGALFLDIVVAQRSAVFELLASEDEALLVRGNALLVLDLRLDVLDGIAGLDFERDGLAGQGLDEDLHDRCCYSVDNT